MRQVGGWDGSKGQHARAGGGGGAAAAVVAAGGAVAAVAHNIYRCVCVRINTKRFIMSKKSHGGDTRDTLAGATGCAGSTRAIETLPPPTTKYVCRSPSRPKGRKQNKNRTRQGRGQQDRNGWLGVAAGPRQSETRATDIVARKSIKGGRTSRSFTWPKSGGKAWIASPMRAAPLSAPPAPPPLGSQYSPGQYCGSGKRPPSLFAKRESSASSVSAARGTWGKLSAKNVFICSGGRRVNLGGGRETRRGEEGSWVAYVRCAV